MTRSELEDHAREARLHPPQDLKSLLIEVAEVQDWRYWPSQVRLACPNASQVALTSAVGAMRLHVEAKALRNPVSIAFAGHALDDAVRRLQAVNG